MENSPVVLLVEDRLDFLHVCTQLLETGLYSLAYDGRVGVRCEVICAKDGDEALKLFTINKDRLNFVVTDFSMPGMDGVELASKIKSISPGISIILNSSGGKPMRAEDRDLFISFTNKNLRNFCNQVAILIQTWQIREAGLKVDMKIVEQALLANTKPPKRFFLF